jgi:hypothetical protein
MAVWDLSACFCFITLGSHAALACARSTRLPLHSSYLLLPKTCSSVTVVDRVLSIASSTLVAQPHVEPSAVGEEADGDEVPMGRLASVPSSVTLAKTYDNVALVAGATLAMSFCRQNADACALVGG